MYSAEYSDTNLFSASESSSQQANRKPASVHHTTPFEQQFGIHRSQSMALSDDEMARDSSDDDSEAPVTVRNTAPSIADFSPESVLDGTLPRLFVRTRSL